MRVPPRSLLVLLPVGVIVGHATGYLIAHAGHTTPEPSHGHVDALTPMLVPLLCIGLMWLIAGRRGRETRLPAAPVLIGSQLVMFATQEVAEHLGAGGSIADAAASSAVRWGMLAQVVVGLGLTWFTRSARRVAATVLALKRRRSVRSTSRWARRPSFRSSHGHGAALSSMSRRGPPRLARFTT